MEQEVKKIYKYEVQISKELFFNESSQWGVYSCWIANEEDEEQAFKEININRAYGTFVMSGNTERLTEGNTYTASFRDSYSEKYGDGYEIIRVYHGDFNSKSSQVDYLKAVVPESYVDGIIEMYGDEENLIEGIISGKYDITKIKGIGEKRREGLINTISNYEEFGEIIDILSPYGFSMNMILRIQNHFKSGAKIKHVLDTDFYVLTEVTGLGFKTVDSYATSLGIGHYSPTRITQGSIHFLAQRAKQGDIKIPIQDFEVELCKMLEIEEVNDEIFNTITSHPKIYYDKGYIALRTYVEEERFIARRVRELMHGAEPVNVSDSDMKQYIAEEEEKNGFKFVKEQIEAIRMPTYSPVTLITGSAGTGKSKTVTAAVNILQKLGYNYIGLALSGKAANVLQQNGLHNSGTLHRMLKWRPVMDSDEDEAGGFVGSDSEDEDIFYDVMIVDEGSMLNNSIFARLLGQVRVGTRIIIVGDKAQLPPMGHGNTFSVLLDSDLPTVRLTKIHRQAQKSGIITSANAVDRGKLFIPHDGYGTHVLGELKDFYVFNFLDKTHIYDAVRQTVQQFLSNPKERVEDLQIITPIKKGEIGTENLNRMVQDLVHPDKTFVPRLEVTKDSYIYQGDRVIQEGNRYDARMITDLDEYLEDPFNDDIEFSVSNVYNGTIGTVVSIAHHPKRKGVTNLVVKYEHYDSTEYIYYSTAELIRDSVASVKTISLGYAMTVHRSQGSGLHTVIFPFDYSSFMLLSKELIYTGMTRAISRLLMFTESNALNYGIRNSKSENRKTYLYEFLEKELSQGKNSLELP